MLRFLLILSLAVPTRASAQASYTCLAPTAASEWIRSVLKQTVSATDSATVAARAELQIPSGDSSIVQPVTEQTVCAQAGAAVATIFPDVQYSTGGWVFQLGPARYYVVDPNAVRGRRAYGVVLDQNFAVLSSDPVS